MSKNKREKGYWLKQKESFKSGDKAKERAGMLRIHEHVSHVLMDKKEDSLNLNNDKYIVSYSVAKWYIEDLNRAGISL
jgi:hypothetical protein